jgi:hypothetical protein
MLKNTWEKILEYASSPLHGTLSRKQRPGVKIQINGGDIFESAILFMGEEFVRITQTSNTETVNVYYNWEMISSIKTIGLTEE